MHRDTDEVIGLFHRCFERCRNTYDAPSWHLVALPEPGSMADQDARTMQALWFTRDVMNRLEQDRFAEAMHTRERKTAHQEYDDAEQ